MKNNTLTLASLFLLAIPSAYAQTEAEALNMELVAHHPLDARPSYQPMPHRYGDRWILFVGHHAGEGINSLNGELEGHATSVLDVTDPANPEYLAHIPAPPWQAEGTISLGTGAQHNMICNAEELPNGTPGRVYMLRSLGNVAHELYDVTDPAAPEFILTVARTGDSPPMEPGADFYDTKGTHKNWWDCETGAAYLVSSITGWKKWRNLQVFDLSTPEEPQHVRDFNLVGTEPTSTMDNVDAPGGYSGLHQITAQGDRVYLAYGMDSSGVIQILDRDRLLNGDPNAADPMAPTPENLLYPEIARVDMPTYYGGHTVYPVPNMPIPGYEQDLDNSSRDILAIVSEVTANECQSARHATFFLDMTDVEFPMNVSTFQVPEEPGDFCNRGGRFGPHASNDSLLGPYYRNILFLSYFNAGVRAVDYRDPFNPVEIGYYVPAVTENTDERCREIDGENRCKVAIQTNNVNYDERGYIYALDRANTGLHILRLTGPAAEIVDAEANR
ncbi:MAG: hypothetical protein HKN84_00125 [Gammaproteobacteria bacterium]|nr:hypothetical protein [Gammaproteobacteria bacterium]